MLTQRQFRFVAEVIRGASATAAALAAGYKSGPHVAGHRLLKLPEIKAAIAERTAWKLEGLDASADRVINELAVIGFSDLNDMVDPQFGAILPIDKIPPKARRAIASLKTTTFPDGRVQKEIKLWPKGPALETLARRWGLTAAPEATVGALTINFVGVKPPAYALPTPPGEVKALDAGGVIDAEYKEAEEAEYILPTETYTLIETATRELLDREDR